MFGLKKKNDENYEKSRNLPYEEKIYKLSVDISCTIAAWLTDQVKIYNDSRRACQLSDGIMTQDYMMMRGKMIMQANGGDYYSDDEIYDNLETIASKRFRILNEIKCNKYTTKQTVQVTDMADTVTVASLFENISEINIDDIIDRIVSFDEKMEANAKKFLELYAQNNKPYGYNPEDEKQKEAFLEECMFVGKYVWKYIQDRDVVEKLVRIFFKCIGSNCVTVKDISELPFVNEYGQFIDDDGNPILEPELFNRKFWGLNSEDEILYKFLDMGYDLRGKLDASWKLRDDTGLVDNTEFPYNMLVPREDAAWKYSVE